jgi:drug/metabolite transporter (DMT)-like permease
MSGKTPPAARVLLIACFAALYVIWGSTYLAIRIAIEDLPPFVMAAVRFLIAGTVLYGFMRARGCARPTAAQWKNAAIVGFLLLACSNGAVVWSEQRVPSGLAAVLVGTLPMWMVLLEWRRDRALRPSPQVVLGLLVGLAGVAVLAGPSAGHAGVDPFAALVLLCASLSWATGSLFARRADLPRSAPLATAMEMLCGGAALLALSLARGDWRGFDPQQVSSAAWLAFGYLIVFGSLVALSAYVWLLNATTPARVATYAYVNPVVAVFLGWAFAGEKLNTRTFVAASLIVAAVVLITTYRGRAASRTGVPHPKLPGAALRGDEA